VTTKLSLEWTQLASSVAQIDGEPPLGRAHRPPKKASRSGLEWSLRWKEKRGPPLPLRQIADTAD